MPMRYCSDVMHQCTMILNFLNPLITEKNPHDCGRPTFNVGNFEYPNFNHVIVILLVSYSQCIGSNLCHIKHNIIVINNNNKPNDYDYAPNEKKVSCPVWLCVFGVERR